MQCEKNSKKELQKERMSQIIAKYRFCTTTEQKLPICTPLRYFSGSLRHHKMKEGKVCKKRYRQIENKEALYGPVNVRYNPENVAI